MRDTQDPTSGPGDPSTGSDETPDVLTVLDDMAATIARLAIELTPERVPGHRVRAITKRLTTIERGVRGIRLVLRQKAADTGDWKTKGHKSPADQVAKEEGISTGQAKREIEASKRLADMPHARDAASRGEISPESAAVVAEGAAADPDAESSLVKTAKRGDLHATRKRAGEVIARADERSGQRARRIYERRALKTWVSVDGEGHGVWNVPVEMHARFLAALTPYRTAAFQAARASGQTLNDETLWADALDLLMTDVLLDTTDTDTDTDTGADHDTDAPPAGTDTPPTSPAPPTDPTTPDPDTPTLFDDDRTDGHTHHDPTDDCQPHDDRTDDHQPHDDRAEDRRADEDGTDDGRAEDRRADEDGTDDGRDEDHRADEDRADGGRADDDVPPCDWIGDTTGGPAGDARTGQGTTGDSTGHPAGEARAGGGTAGDSNEGRTGDGPTSFGPNSAGEARCGAGTHGGGSDGDRVEGARVGSGRPVPEDRSARHPIGSETARPATGPSPPGPTGPRGSGRSATASRPTGPGERRPPAEPSGPRVVPMAGRRPSTPAPRSRRAPAQVHVLVDFDALRRGYACDGDTCEIPGVGPIPVTLAEHLMQDSLLRLIVTGTDITKVTSHRRYVPEEVRRALFARDKGACVVCGSTRFLELHHYVEDFAKGCPTEYGTLAHVCSREHALITHCGWVLHHTEAGWHFQPPTGTTGKDPP